MPTKIGTRRRVGLLLTVAAAATLALGCGTSPDLSRVQLDSGPIVGIHEQSDQGELWVFRGIPYASPPVGELRWRAPRPVESWEAARDCTEFGPACPQPGMFGGFSLAVGSTDEDCLYLNVWSPARSPTEKLPVMVWIHGGSFETGSGSMEIYDGRHLAAEGVVVVTINYRLGPLGFFSHPALSDQEVGGVSGNYGLMDQIAALEWVQRNIDGFGGDPDNVTVFGESAGAISILDLLVSPPAEGLFQRAIVQSGVLMDQGFDAMMVAEQGEAEAVGEEVAGLLGVDPEGEAAAELRARSVDELLEASSEVAAGGDQVQGILFWKPVVDGRILPDLPTALWLSGRHHDVSLLIGSNADEADLFLPGLDMSQDRYEVLVREIFGEHAPGVLSLYPGTGPGGTLSAVGRMLTEIGFASSARFAARMVSADVPDVYLYEFARAPLPLLMGAFHAVELPYVFGTLDVFSWLGVIDAVDRQLSSTIRGYWTRFAATGDPNGGGAPTWPKYEAESDLHLRLDSAITAEAGLYTQACDLADKVRGAR